MIVAAYVVGGFLVASVYAVGMLRGRRDRYHRLGFLIPFTVAAIAMPIQMGVGDSLARWVYNNQPVKFAAIELVPETSSDVPETLLGHLNSDGTVSGGLAIPGFASWLSDPSDGTATVVQGLDTRARRRAPHRPPGERRAPRLGRHGRAGHAAVPDLASGTAPPGCSAATCPRAACSCGSPRPWASLAVITMEAGWVVSEVGRQPWIVYNLQRVDDAATANTGVWIMFVARRAALPRPGRHPDLRAPRA